MASNLTDWSRDPADFSHVLTGQRVKVRMGAGWSKGTVAKRGVQQRYMSIKLDDAKRSITVWDSRNIKPM
jgi:uncharacterized protein (DUF736 family)